LTLVGVVYAIARGADSILIGRVFGTEALGIYSRATTLLTRPLERLMSPLQAVVVPALSRLHAEPERYRRGFLQVFEAVVIMGFLFVGLFFPLASPFVVLILGQQWEAVAPIFAALTVSALHIPASTAASWLFTSQGRGRDLLLAATLGSCLMVGAWVVGLRFGLLGVAVAYSASGTAIGLPLMFFFAGRRGPVGALDLWLALGRHTPLLVIVFTATWLTRSAAPTLQTVGQLVLSGTAGLAAAAVTTLLFPPTRRATARLLNALLELRSG
jgi:PST family polysaccharide transporter